MPTFGSHNLTPLPAGAVVSPEQAASLMEQQGYVQIMPTLETQAQDTTRQTPFTYLAMRHLLLEGDPNNPRFAENSRQVTMTEVQGLQGLKAFLRAQAEKPGPKDPNFVQPDEIEASINFLGQPEFANATAGTASYWKAFLAADERHQLYLPMPLSKMYDATGATPAVKSDKYVLDSILQNFSDNELDQFAPRMHDTAANLTAKPEHSKVVLVDDVSSSGYQLNIQKWLAQHELHPREEYARSIEANLLVATPGQLHWGIEHSHTDAAEAVFAVLEDEDTTETERARILEKVAPWIDPEEAQELDPSELSERLGETALGSIAQIKGYYVTRDLTQTGRFDTAPVTSLHSSIDFGFEGPIARIVNGNPDLEMPPLTNIIRKYRDGSLPNIERWKARIENS